jgi:hypothetical protein
MQQYSTIEHPPVDDAIRTLRDAADEIDQLRRELKEEHALYLIRTEERDEALAQLARAVEVVKWYGDVRNNYNDCGMRARDLLKELGPG